MLIIIFPLLIAAVGVLLQERKKHRDKKAKVACKSMTKATAERKVADSPTEAINAAQDMSPMPETIPGRIALPQESNKEEQDKETTEPSQIEEQFMTEAASPPTVQLELEAGVKSPQPSDRQPSGKSASIERKQQNTAEDDLLVRETDGLHIPEPLDQQQGSTPAVRSNAAMSSPSRTSALRTRSCTAKTRADVEAKSRSSFELLQTRQAWLLKIPICRICLEKTRSSLPTAQRNNPFFMI